MAAGGLIRGEQIISVDIPFSASKVWEVYANTHQLAQIFKSVPSDDFEDIEVVGDGGLGSHIIVTFKPGNPLKQFTEIVMILDHERRVKEVEVTEGGFLSLGYTSFHTRFEILPKGLNMATVRKIMRYNVREDSAANLSLASANDNPYQVQAVEAFLNGSSTSN